MVPKVSAIETAHPPATIHKGGYCLIALGIITLIGSLAIAGCFYSRLGYSSFAIGGAGVILGGLSILVGRSCCVNKTVKPQKIEEINAPLQPQEVAPQKVDKSAPLPPKSAQQKVDKTDVSPPIAVKLPPLFNLQVDPSSSLSKSLLGVTDQQLLRCSLQDRIKGGCKQLLSEDPQIKKQVALIYGRIEALNQAIQLTERATKLNLLDQLKIWDLLDSWPDGGLLKFRLLYDEELVTLTLSSIKANEDDKPLWDILCERLQKLADKNNFVLSPNVNISTIRLVDLPKLKANQINSHPGLFPSITFLLMDFQEFTRVAIHKVSFPQKIVAAIFFDAFMGENSKAAKRLLSCTPEAIYQLSPYFSYHVWRLLDPPLLSQLDFSKVFAGIKDEGAKQLLVGEIFYDSYVGENSKGANRLLSCQPEAIYQLSPYIPNATWRLLGLPILSKLNFARVFAGIKDDAAKKTVVAEIFYDSFVGKDSNAAKRLLSCPPEVIYQLSPYTPYQVWRLLDPPLLSQLDFSKVFAGIKDEAAKRSLVGDIFYDAFVGKDSQAAKRLLSCRPEAIYQLSPYIPYQAWKLLSPAILAHLDFSKVFAGIKDEAAKRELVGDIFHDAFAGNESQAARRLLSCPPEAIYQLSPYLSFQVWRLLGPTLLSQLNFARVFANIKSDADKASLVGEIFHNSFAGKESEAAKRLLSCPPEVIYQLSPYLPNVAWRLLGQPLLSKLDFSKVFAGIKQDADKRSILGEIFHDSFAGNNSEAAKRLLSCPPEVIYQLSPYLPNVAWRLLGQPLLSKLDFTKVFAGIKQDADKRSILGEIFHDTFAGNNSEAAKRLKSLSQAQKAHIRPFLSQTCLKLLA